MDLMGFVDAIIFEKFTQCYHLLKNLTRFNVLVNILGILAINT